MEPAEIIEVDDDTETVGCDGGGGALGHPMVYYTFGNLNALDCAYCGRRFVRAHGVHPAETAPEAVKAVSGA